MGAERLEEVCLINDLSYLHLKENEQGFQYVLFDKESKSKVCEGQIDWTELEASPIGNPLAAARQYAFADIGIDVESVTRVSADILESFLKEQMLTFLPRYSNAMTLGRHCEPVCFVVVFLFVF